MKTNQVMVRKMGHFSVLQRTSDGMFNATSLLKHGTGNPTRNGSWTIISHLRKPLNL